MKILIYCNNDPFNPHSGYQIPIFYRLKFYNFKDCLVIVNSDIKDIRIEDVVFFNRKITVIHANVFEKYSKLKALFIFLVLKKPFFSIKKINHPTLTKIEKIILNFKPDISYFEGHNFPLIHDYLMHKSLKIISINDSLPCSYSEEFRNKINKNVSTRILKRMNYSRILKYEKESYQKFDICQVVSKYDSSFLNRLNSNINLRVNKIGVDSLYFQPNNSSISNTTTFLIVGNLIGGNYVYTNLFIKNVWVPFFKRNPEFKLRIISRTIPKKFYRKTKKINVQIDSDINDLANCYANCFVVINPVLKSCGMLNKVLEGMAMAKTIVGYKGSFVGIEESVNMKHFLEADDHVQFIQILEDLIKQKFNTSEIGLKARKLILENYEWKDLVSGQFARDNRLVSFK